MPPPKSKSDLPEEAPAPMRVTRAAAKRAATSAAAAAISDPLPARKKAKKAKVVAQKKKDKKEKKEVQVESEDKVEKEEESEASENFLEASNNKVIVVEHCKQCHQFKMRANMVKDGLEKAGCGITVILNPEKPRRGCFEIRLEGGKKFITLLDMKRPFKPMRDLDMEKVISDIINEMSKAG